MESYPGDIPLSSPPPKSDTSEYENFERGRAVGAQFERARLAPVIAAARQAARVPRHTFCTPEGKDAADECEKTLRDAGELEE